MKNSDNLPFGDLCPTVATTGSQLHSAGREPLYANAEYGPTLGSGTGHKPAPTEAYLLPTPACFQAGNAICSTGNRDHRALYPHTAPARGARRPDSTSPGAWGG